MVITKYLLNKNNSYSVIKAETVIVSTVCATVSSPWQQLRRPAPFYLNIGDQQSLPRNRGDIFQGLAAAATLGLGVKMHGDTVFRVT